MGHVELTERYIVYCHMLDQDIPLRSAGAAVTVTCGSISLGRSEYEVCTPRCFITVSRRPLCEVPGTEWRAWQFWCLPHSPSEPY
jgi:hypothetical protein